jgi:hypothetical protein
MSKTGIVFFLLWMSVPAPGVAGGSGHLQSQPSSKPTSETQFGYHGPEKLGPLSIANRRGGMNIHRLWVILGTKELPDADFICYFDQSQGAYLILERAHDDFSLVRGLTLSRINDCPAKEIRHASGFAGWSTGKGIHLGSSENEVLARYKTPSRVDRAGNNSRFFSPYSDKAEISSRTGDRHVLVYLPKDDAPDLSHAFFGIQNGRVVWMTVSRSE